MLAFLDLSVTYDNRRSKTDVIISPPPRSMVNYVIVARDRSVAGDDARCSAPVARKEERDGQQDITKGIRPQARSA